MVDLKKGDIFMTNNFSITSKIVCFLMTEKTLWIHLYKLLTKKKLNEVRFYHVGMVLDQDTMIEQQGKVEINSTSKIFRKNYIIWRNTNLTEEQAFKLQLIAEGDLGEGYGILECIGKTISWLTGIKYFSKWFDMKDRAICAIRTIEWYNTIGETFGKSNPNYHTTDTLDEFLQQSEEWQIIGIRYE